jgi:tetratricopeptide (TPR) repeat protein
LRSVEGATSLPTIPTAKLEKIRKRYGRKEYMDNLRGPGGEEHDAILPVITVAATTSENVSECTTAFETASHSLQSTDIFNRGTQDPWPFDWKSVDAPNSPGLSRLFGQLNLELCIDVPSLDLNASEWLLPAADENINVTEVSSDIIPCPTEGDFPLYLTNSGSYPPWVDAAASSKYLNYGLENEIGFFPESFGFRSMREARLRSLKRNALVKKPTLHQLEIILKQQEKSMRDHPQAISFTMREIGFAYVRSLNYSKAETFFRRSLKLLEINRHANEDLIFNISLEISDTLRFQGRFQDALELLDNVRANIADYCADHPRYLQLTDAVTHVFTAMAVCNAGFESLLREALQIELVKDGPWSDRSMYFVRELGTLIARTCQDRNIRDPLIKNIVNTILQHFGVLEPDDPYFALILDPLIVIYDFGGFHEECKQLVYFALERARLVFGENHWWTLNFSCRLAVELNKQGLLQECARLCQDTLGKYARLSDDVVELQMVLISLYGQTLYTMQQFEEATLWLRKLYELNRDRKADLMFACKLLGACYESQGHYENATDLYLLTIAELETRNENHSNIQLVKEWLRVCQSKIPESHGSSSQESSVSDAMDLNVAQWTSGDEETAIYSLGNEDGANECMPPQTSSSTEMVYENEASEMWAFINLQQADLGADSA